MSKLQRSNIYFLIIMLLIISLPDVLIKIYLGVGINDIRIIQFLNHVILFLIPAIIYIKVSKVNIRETFRLNRIPLKSLFLIILITFASYPLMGCISAITQMFFENNVGVFMAAISNTSYLGMMLLMAVTPAITEEVTLRGIVLSGYNEQSKFKAALITGILFGVFHMDFQQFFYAAVLGFIFAYIVRITNSIFASVIMHFLINGISVTTQKILFSSEELINQIAEEPSLIGLSLGAKISYMSTYIIIGAIFAFLVYKLIRKLESFYLERNIMVNDEEEGSKEGIFNWSFITIILIYLIYMIYNMYKG